MSSCLQEIIVSHTSKQSDALHHLPDSKHFFIKSLPIFIKTLIPTHSEQVFCKRYCYVKPQDSHAYVALVTDLYSKSDGPSKLRCNMKTTPGKDAFK